ncbi:hypothetical protein LTR65_009007 [Meristemomyces frigidus]
MSYPSVPSARVTGTVAATSTDLGTTNDVVNGGVAADSFTVPDFTNLKPALSTIVPSTKALLEYNRALIDVQLSMTGGTYKGTTPKEPNVKSVASIFEDLKAEGKTLDLREEALGKREVEVKIFGGVLGEREEALVKREAELKKTLDDAKKTRTEMQATTSSFPQAGMARGRGGGEWRGGQRRGGAGGQARGGMENVSNGHATDDGQRGRDGRGQWRGRSGFGVRGNRGSASQ